PRCHFLGSAQRGSAENGPQRYRRQATWDHLMLRVLKLVCPLLVVWGLLALAAPALAQSTGWPEYRLDPSGTGDAHKMVRGPGGYLSVVKIVLSTLVFLAWV